MACRVEQRDSLDFFATPPWATRALVERVLRHLGIDLTHARAALDVAWWVGHLLAGLSAEGEAVLLTPFRAGAAHVVQLGTIGVENARCAVRDRGTKALSYLARKGADVRQLT